MDCDSAHCSCLCRQLSSRHLCCKCKVACLNLANRPKRIACCANRGAWFGNCDAWADQVCCCGPVKAAAVHRERARCAAAAGCQCRYGEDIPQLTVASIDNGHREHDAIICSQAPTPCWQGMCVSTEQRHTDTNKLYRPLPIAPRKLQQRDMHAAQRLQLTGKACTPVPSTSAGSRLVDTVMPLLTGSCSPDRVAGVEVTVWPVLATALLVLAVTDRLVLDVASRSSKSVCCTAL